MQRRRSRLDRNNAHTSQIWRTLERPSLLHMSLVRASGGALAPAFPCKGVGAHPLSSYGYAVASLQLTESRAARVMEGTMDVIPRRWSGPARPQAVRPQNPGNARQRYEQYLVRAREAQLSGDVVEMENCYQHAEHYFRVLRGDDHERRDQL